MSQLPEDMTHNAVRDLVRSFGERVGRMQREFTAETVRMRDEFALELRGQIDSLRSRLEAFGQELHRDIGRRQVERDLMESILDKMKGIGAMDLRLTRLETSESIRDKQFSRQWVTILGQWAAIGGIVYWVSSAVSP